MTYNQKLEETKDYYPFDNWLQAFDDGLLQYTRENCNRTKAIFDTLISQLTGIGQNAAENNKVGLFKTAILALNALNEDVDGLIETGEREDLCDLVDRITIAAGLTPGKYGDGDGLADEWRDW
jgi:hypothetical protein